MPWYRVYKTYRNGESPKDFFEVPKYTHKEDVKAEAENWADKAEGGHCNGWTVYWEKVRKPPKAWIKEKIREYKSAAESYKELANELIQLIMK